MRLVRDMAKRFNSARYLPRSLVAMRAIAIAGIAIGSATLVVALSIVSGFQREYRRSILDFNAHIVVLKAGEMNDTSEATNYALGRRETEEDARFQKRFSWMVPFADELKRLYRGAINLHDDIAFKFENHPDFLAFWDRIHPEHIRSKVPDFLRRILQINEKGVIGVTPFLYREGLAISKGIIKGIVIKGVDPKTIRDVNQMRLNINTSLDEALAPSDKNPKVIIGKALAEHLGIAPPPTPSPSRGEGRGEGDHVVLMVPEIHKGKQFISAVVVGTFESGLYDYDSQFALMNIDDTRKIFETGQIKASGIEIKLSDPQRAAAIADLINNDLPASYQAITWSELNRDLFEALSLEKLVFTIIMGILVIVAAFNIIGVLVLLICYRGHEVAILKALGMRTRLLEKIFTRGGVATGLFGTIIGIAGGIAISWAIKHFQLIRLEPEIYFVRALPIDISWPICGMIAIFSVLMCWGTSRLAAKRLATLSISENL